MRCVSRSVYIYMRWVNNGIIIGVSFQVTSSSSVGAEDFDFVIVTVPLGVLKERKLDLFVPQLPADKIRAIDALGFGLCNKIYLEFESKDIFWEPTAWFQILWQEDIPESERDWSVENQVEDRLALVISLPSTVQLVEVNLSFV